MSQRPGTTRDHSLSVGWGLIGASRIARHAMIDAIRQQPPLPEAPEAPPSWVVGIYSRNASRGRLFAEETQLAHAYESLEAMLRRPEIKCIYVSSHPRLQTEMVLAAIDAGKHVLCETPLGLSVDEAVEMHEHAQQQGVLLAVNYALRANPALDRMATLLRDSAIGEVVGGHVSNMEPLPLSMQTWRLEPNGGGVILDRTIHNIDLIRWLVGDEIEVVSSMAGKLLLSEAGNEVEEDVLGALRLHRSGIAFQLRDAFTMLHEHSALEIYGTGGTLIAHHWWDEWRQSRLLLVRNDEVHQVPLDPANPYARVVAAFNEAVRTERVRPRLDPLLATGADGIRNLHAALALRESLQKGQTLWLY